MKLRWVLIVLTCMLCGCAYANPRTELGGGWTGWHFYDNKDNDILLEGGKFNPETSAFEIDKLDIRNNASDVREINVEQMKAHTEQMRVMTEGIRSMISAIVSAIPGAQSPTSAPVDLSPLIERLESIEMRIGELESSATRPSG